MVSAPTLITRNATQALAVNEWPVGGVKTGPEE
jgi:hypothetical protein